MRQLIVICAAMLAVVGCENKGKGKLLKPDAKISIYPAKEAAAPAQGAAAKAVADYPTALQVVQQTTDIAFQSHDYPNEPYCNVGISAEQKDEANLRIMMWGEQIIRNGELNPFFIEAYDVVFVTRVNGDKSKPISDTLAYIPNASLQSAATAIKTAYALEDYELVYKLFDVAYRFTPINGKDWRKLKAENKN